MKKYKKYGVSSEEAPLLESAKCREILNEILDFGVSQHQIAVLIKLLALELEDRDKMLEIVSVISGEDLNQNSEDASKPTITV